MARSALFENHPIEGDRSGRGGRPEDLWNEAPGTAADNMRQAVAGRARASVTRIALVAVIPAVCRPIPHVAVYVEKSPGVCLEAVDRDGLRPIRAFHAVSICIIAVIIGLVR